MELSIDKVNNRERKEISRPNPSIQDIPYKPSVANKSLEEVGLR